MPSRHGRSGDNRISRIPRPSNVTSAAISEGRESRFGPDRIRLFETVDARIENGTTRKTIAM